jgi:DNA-binding MltR family transcriptional regulator
MPKRGGSKGAKARRQDLLREIPEPELFRRIILELRDMNATAAALVLTSIVDNFLEEAIALNMVPLSPSLRNSIFRGKYGPLSDFSSKITVAFALGVYNDEIRKQLDVLREIRNIFAHSMLDRDFNDIEISRMCADIDVRRIASKRESWMEHEEPRERFLVVGLYAAMHLAEYNAFRGAGEHFGSLPGPTPFRGKYE